MLASISRRALFGRLRGGPPQLRPPWTGEEARFLETCNACGECLRACPTGLLARGHAGYPIADFARGSCTFCGRCADACHAGCFTRSSGRVWDVRASISAGCVEAKGVACRRCEEACEASAIKFRPRLAGGSIAVIDGLACTGCGACVAPCPVAAISVRIGSEEVV